MHPFFDPYEPMPPAGSPDYVCSVHFEDGFLVDWIDAHAVERVCGLCGCAGERPIAAPTDDVVDLIRESIESDWSDENVEIPWGMDVEALTTYDLVVDLQISSDKSMIDLLIQCLPDRGWVQREFFRLTPAERLEVGWNQFKDLVQHRSRFLFSLEERDNDDPDDVAPLQLLSELGGAAAMADLLTEWETGTPVWRARVHSPDESVEHAWHLATLPEDFADRAAANRMSAAGVPMFYGAASLEAACVEARGADPEASDKVLTSGKFETIRSLRILDLTKMIEIPSLFDPERRHLHAPLSFLLKFLEDLGKPVVRDGLEHVEYVPTQVVSEYFRSVFKFGDNLGVDGIAYPSTQVKEATNVVLFISNMDVEDPDGARPPEPKRLALFAGNYPYDPAILRLVEVSRG